MGFGRHFGFLLSASVSSGTCWSAHSFPANLPLSFSSQLHPFLCESTRSTSTSTPSVHTPIFFLHKHSRLSSYLKMPTTWNAESDAVLFRAILASIPLASQLSPEQRNNIVAFMRGNGCPDVTWEGVRYVVASATALLNHLMSKALSLHHFHPDGPPPCSSLSIANPLRAVLSIPPPQPPFPLNHCPAIQSRYSITSTTNQSPWSTRERSKTGMRAAWPGV